MLIVPLHKKISARNFPLVTLILVIANVIVYFGLQGGDRELEMEAARYYHDSGLSQQEWDWFKEYLDPGERETISRVRELDHYKDQGVPDELLAYARSRLIESHPGFLDELRAGGIVPADSEAFLQWETSRDAYEALVGRSFTNRYLLRYDEVDPISSVVHMFMHGSLGHLLGNMLFLVLLGILVEGALGRGLYLGCYLTAGLGSAAASLLVHWGTPMGGLGASGAIAGLMGMYTVLYGMRRVRFFYWVFVYFDYVRAPAIILLPAWLGWELWQFFMDDWTNVAYEAHIGGIVTGAVLALGIRGLGLQRDEFLDEETKREADREAMQAALADLSALRIPQAKQKLRPLLERHPDDVELLRTWYGACKLKAEDPHLHEAAARILRLEGKNEIERQLVAATYADYRRRTQPKMNLRQAVRLAGRLVRWGAIDEARDLIDRLLRLPQAPSGLGEACLTLASRLCAESRHDDAAPYIDQAERLASVPATAQAARALCPRPGGEA
jgi:membrane associated rhomboid family serine protease